MRIAEHHHGALRLWLDPHNLHVHQPIHLFRDSRLRLDARTWAARLKVMDEQCAQPGLHRVVHHDGDLGLAKRQHQGVEWRAGKAEHMNRLYVAVQRELRGQVEHTALGALANIVHLEKRGTGQYQIPGRRRGEMRARGMLNTRGRVERPVDLEAVHRP